MADHRRASDRWVTPGVIIVAIFVAGVLVLATVAAVTYLTAQGRDPDPMLRLVAQAVTAVGSLGTLLFQLTGRSTVAKVERNTGQLTGVVADALDELDAQAAAHAQAAQAAQAAAEATVGPSYALPPVPPACPSTQAYETAPARPEEPAKTLNSDAPRGPFVPGR